MTFFIISSMSLFTVGHHNIVPLSFISSKHLYQLLSSCRHRQWMVMPMYTVVRLLAAEDKILLRNGKHL